MASSYLSKTPASATNRRTFTISFWLKTSVATGDYTLFYSAGSGSHEFKIAFDTSERLYVYDFNGTSFDILLKTNRVFRDTSAFYNIVYEIDTTNATADDRIKLYVNGVQETSFSDRTNPSQNHDTEWNGTGVHYIGRDGSGSYIDGILTHIHNIDGTAYDADTFGETDATTGIWKPKTAPSVTYGTNGFFLKGENSGALGTDSSGNGNDFTINGTPTQTVDTPSNVFATMNPLYRTTNINFSNGNNTITSSSGSWNAPASTLAASTGKWYVEGKTTGYNHNAVGVASNPNDNSAGYPFEIAGGYGYKLYTGGTTTQGADNVSYGDTLANGDIFQIALDLDNSKIYFGKNGTWQNSGVPTSGATGTGAAFTLPSNETYHFVNALNLQTGGASSQWNFGNGYFGTTAVASAGTSTSGDDSIWEYDCPTGYYGLNTKNINEQEYS